MEASSLPQVSQPESDFGALPIWLGPFAWGIYAVAQGSWLFWAWQIVRSGTGDFDFSTYYAAARALRLDHHADIYAATVLAASGAAGHVFLQPPLPFTYPPLAAILLEPLTTLSFAAATHVWLAINLMAWLLCTLVLAGEAYVVLRPIRATPAMPTRLMGKTDESTQRMRRWISEPAVPIALALAALVCLSERPAAQTITLGQINFLVALPLALVPRLLRTGHDGWAGAVIALAAMLKITPILLLAYLVLRGRQRAGSSALAVLALLIMVCLIVVGPAHLLATIPQALHVGNADASLPQNEALLAVPLLVAQINAPALAAMAHDVSYGLLLLIAVALGAIVFATRHTDTRTGNAHDDTLAYGVALCGMLLISPTVWAHHYIWVLPSLVLALAWSLHRVCQTAASPPQRRIAVTQLALSSAAWLIIAYTLPFDLDFQPALRSTIIFGLSLTDWSHWLRPLATVILAGVLTSFIWPRRAMPIAAKVAASPSQERAE